MVSAPPSTPCLRGESLFGGNVQWVPILNFFKGVFLNKGSSILKDDNLMGDTGSEKVQTFNSRKTSGEESTLTSIKIIYNRY